MTCIRPPSLRMLWMSTNGIGVAAPTSPCSIHSSTRRYLMRTRLLATGALVAASALLLAGCSGGSSSSDSSSAAVNTNPDGKGQTLTLWDYEDDTSAMGIAWNAAIKEFESETGATVNYEAKSFEGIRSTASQVLNSDAAPDILEYNKGNAT